MAQALERTTEAYKELTVDLERIVGMGDRLVSVLRFRGTARHTGIAVDERVGYLWAFRDGKVIHLRSFRNPADALQAIGVTE